LLLRGRAWKKNPALSRKFSLARIAAKSFAPSTYQVCLEDLCWSWTCKEEEGRPRQLGSVRGSEGRRPSARLNLWAQAPGELEEENCGGSKERPKQDPREKWVLANSSSNEEESQADYSQGISQSLGWDSDADPPAEIWPFLSNYARRQEHNFARWRFWFDRHIIRVTFLEEWLNRMVCAMLLREEMMKMGIMRVRFTILVEFSDSSLI
jgi:hypothetical protein